MPPPARSPAPGPPTVSDAPPPVDVEPVASPSAPGSSVPPANERSVAARVAAPGLPANLAVAATPAVAVPAEPDPAAHRVCDAVGGIVRTLLVAALVAGPVFGGRYAWDWNEERHSEATLSEVLPATPVPAVDVRFAQFRGGSSGSVTAHVDLASPDYVADIATSQLARRDSEYWMRNIAEGVWVPASTEFLESIADERNAAEQAALLMITDVISVGAQPYVPVTADEVITLAGEAIPGPKVIEVDSPDTDRGAIDEQRTAAVPAGVVTRHVTLTVDRLAVQTADAALAESSGLGGTLALVLDIWVDATSCVWR
jgi:hypothetical protein